MPLSVTSNYRAVHNRKQRIPNYFVRFERADEIFSTHKTSFSSKAYMQLPSSVSAEIVPEKGQSSIGSVSVVLTDFNGSVTRLVGLGLGGDIMTLYSGFQGLDEADYVVRFTGIVDNVRTAPNSLAAYEITAHSPDILANRQWPTALGMTALVGEISDVVDGAEVVDTTLFEDSGFIIIDGEIIQYAAKTETTLTGFTRGALGSVAAEHSDDATVREMLRIGPAHPLDIRELIYQGTGKAGLAIDASLIDLATSAAVKADIDASNPTPSEPYLMEFRIAASENAKHFIEDEIHAPTATYPITTAGGLLSIKQFRQPSAVGAEVINHDFILGGGGTLQLSWNGNMSSVINDITYLYDYDVISEEFKSAFNLKSQTSIDKYGRRPVVIQSRGIRTEHPGGVTMMQLRAAAFLNRYKDAAPLVELTTYLQQSLAEPGDIVRVTSHIIPNRFTLLRGVENSLMEAIGLSNNFDMGTVSFKLLWTGFALASVYAPELEIDWNTASQPERETYAFYADEDGNNGGSIPGQRYAF